MAGSALGWIELTAEILIQAKHKHGEQAQHRLIRWQNLLTSAKNLPENDKLKQVNAFFNLNVLFIDDIIHWKTEDYWATPLEFLATGAGDCEDFAIAKYFTLLELGVDERLLGYAIGIPGDRCRRLRGLCDRQIFHLTGTWRRRKQNANYLRQVTATQSAPYGINFFCLTQIGSGSARQFDP